MNKKEALQQIEELKKFIENEDKKSKFVKVKFSKNKDILLTDEDGNYLIDTWETEKDLNDFEDFERYNVGHAFIYGQNKPFEIIDNECKVLLKSDKLCHIRFLEELE